jgi:hypothetical protein
MANYLMRPDGVMRSSIIQPAQGFDPRRNAHAVAQQFTVLSGTEGFARGGLWGFLKTKLAKRHAIMAAPTQAAMNRERLIASTTQPSGDGGPDAASAANLHSVAMDITRAANSPGISPDITTGGPMSAGPQVTQANNMAERLAAGIGGRLPSNAIAAGTRAAWAKWLDIRTGRNGF